MRTWKDFLALSDSVSPITPVTAPSQILSRQEALLKDLGIRVIGELENNRIVCFSDHYMKAVEIRAIERYRIENLLQNFGPELEDKVHSSSSQKPPGIPYTMSEVRRAIASEASKRRIVSTDKIGGGVWEIKGRLLLVGEHEIATYNGKLERSRIPYIEGKLLDFDSVDHWYDFDQLSQRIQQAQSIKWCQQVLEELENLFSLWDNWKYPNNDPVLAAGLVLVTWLQTTWWWRPLVFVRGPAGSGKSVLLDDTLSGLYGKLHVAIQRPTEAGLQQMVGQTAKIASIDEFEESPHRGRIFALARTSGLGGKIPKGSSQGGRPRMYGLRHILWFGAIESGLVEAPDLGRFITLDLLRVRKQSGQKLLQIPARHTLADLGQRSLAVAMRHWQAVRSLCGRLREQSIIGVDHRAIESYGLPAAMVGSIMGLSVQETVGLLEGFLTCRDLQVEEQSDEARLVQEILGSFVWTDNRKQASVSQLLSDENLDPGVDALERCGVKHLREVMGSGERIFLVPNAVRRYLLKDTGWRGTQIGEILLRVNGAERSRQRIGGKRRWGITLPSEEVDRLLGGDGYDDETGVSLVDDQESTLGVF